METTVTINTATPTGKRLIKELQRHPRTVRFENPATTGMVPKGYMTAEEFREKAMQDTQQFCQKQGIL